MKITIKDKEYELEELHITGISSDEKEMTINLGYLDETAHIYTSDDAWLTKIKKRVLANPTEWKITRVVERKDGSVSGVMAEVPKNLVSLRTKKKELVISDEERQVRSDRLRNIATGSRQ